MSASVDLVCVDPALVASVLPKVEHWLRAASERTRASDWSDDQARIMRGEALLWLMCRGLALLGAGTTELHRFNGDLFCYVTACGGEDRRAWRHLLERIEEYAKAEGCKTVRMLGRKGWARVLDDYAPTLVMLEKGLN